MISKEAFVQLISDKIDAGDTFPAFHDNDGIHRCFYGEKDSNRHCFIGVLLPENHPAMYCSEDVELLLKAYPELRNCIEGVTVHQLLAIQVLHDNTASFKKDFKENKTKIIEQLKRILQIV